MSEGRRPNYEIGQPNKSSAFRRPQAPAVTPEPALVPVRRTPKHCWVSELPQMLGRWPGIVTEWRLGDDGWSGRVVYAVPDGVNTILVEAWVAARYLSSASDWWGDADHNPD